MVVRAFPVLYACAGCPEFGYLAGEVAAILDRGGLAEMVSLAGAGIEPKARFPIVALDGCDKACAQRWLESQGVRAERNYILTSYDPRSVQRAAHHIAADL